jgi:hypothetical protein
MVSPKRVLFISVFVVTACIDVGEAFAGPREVGTYVLNAARNLWKRASEPPLKFPEPTELPDPYIASATTTKLVSVDRALAKDRNIKRCRDGELGYDYGRLTYDSNHHEICTYSLHRSDASEKVNRDTIIKRLNDNRKLAIAINGTFLIRSKIGPGEVELTKGWPQSTTEWSNNPGRHGINLKDACQLCTSVDDNYIIPRGYVRKDGVQQCTCKKWAKRGEKFEVCNCDVCDAFIIPMGLRAKCMEMATRNIREGYLSRYVALHNHNVFIRVYNDYQKVGKAHDNAIADVQKEHTVCRSGVQGKEIENYSGKLFGDAERLGAVCPQLLKDALKH